MLFVPILMQTALLAIEAGEVIERRMTMFATGAPEAPAEAMLMVGEKFLQASLSMGRASALLAQGVSPDAVVLDTIGDYRSAVGENRRRLA
ncbi:hypothetical protein V8J36_12880 [Frigidibacter sp. MR17.14]|uniref:hypothetical protein n=1 Tax=Frigidibacter sp. MR17.14 TaxID=3126509 RepID=UPI003012EAF2